MPWATKSCEICGKRKPCVPLDEILKGKMLKALQDREEPNGEEAEGKNVQGLRG